MLDPIKQEKDTEIKEKRDHFSTKPKEEEDKFPAKPSSNLAIASKEPDMRENGYGASGSAKRIKLRKEDSISTFLTLKGFFELVQKQHPESRLELKQLDGNWRVWCGACKKLLRPDKSGKAIHNIQRQHFTSARHKKKLHLMLQAEAEEAERQTSEFVKGSSATHDDEPRDGKNTKKVPSVSDRKG